jgi:hypothetical protein
MNSRERFIAALNHQSVDKVCVDFGGTIVTGVSAVAVSRLRQHLLNDKNYRVKVIEPYLMLGELDDQLIKALEIDIDIEKVSPPQTLFGFENKDWKPFTLWDGTEVLVSSDFNVTPAPDGGWFIYPQGDTSVPPSGRMPKGGFYFDSISRQKLIDENKLDPADNMEEFGLLTEADIKYISSKAQKTADSGKGGILTIPGASFGDIATVPAMWMKHVKGIRDVEEWYISTVARRDYIYKVFQGQCEFALKNLESLIKVIGDNVQAVFATGTDFGTQRGLFISPKTYRDLYMPFHKAINDYTHKHSNWKTFIHTCGSVTGLIPDFIEVGFDILNPVQCSAEGMDPRELKREFGKDLVLWGGGVDTQKMLPFGTPDEVYNQVRERIDIFNQDGGFIFNSIHNIQATTPVENMLAMFKAIRDSNK